MRVVMLCLILLAWATPAARGDDEPPLVLVIVLDGLRPDYVTEDWMPTLHALGERGVFFERHHAAIPTVTRVNSPSLSTGSYPETHGLMGNSIYIPSVDPERSLNTSDYENLLKVREAEGKLLTATTIGEVLDDAVKTYLAISSGSSGSAYLLNPELNGAGLINVDLILPESLRARVESAVGRAPEETMPATPRVAWTVDAYIELGLKEIKPDVTFMWMTDPDHTAHATGIGDPVMVESLKGVDAQIARIVRAHEQLGIADRMNILVTSDHGFSTSTGGANVSLLLRQNGFAAGVHVAGDAIYVDGHDEDRIRAIVDLLCQQPTIGAIFTRGESANSVAGWVPGTFSFDVIHWQHARAGDILAFPNWDNEPNSAGFKGRTMTGGVAGHGSTSYWDVHNTLIAHGPAFKRGMRSEIASANPDVAPTVLKILGIDPPATMTGRALLEALEGGPDFAEVNAGESVVMSIAKPSADPAGLEPMVQYTDVEGRRYFTHAVRIAGPH